MKIREIKTIQAEFKNFKVIGIFNEEPDTHESDWLSVYYQIEEANFMMHMFSIKIDRNFKTDFEQFVKCTFIYTWIIEECERKMEAQDEYCDIYFSVYKEILDILRGGENNGIRKKYKNHNKWSRNRNK